MAQAPLRKVKVSGIFCWFVPGLAWSLFGALGNSVD